MVKTLVVSMCAGDAKCCRGAPYVWDEQYLQVPVKTMSAGRMCNLHRYSVHRIEQ